MQAEQNTRGKISKCRQSLSVSVSSFYEEESVVDLLGIINEN